jgi:hypothetical protein
VKRRLSQCERRSAPLSVARTFAELLHHVARRSLTAQVFE